MNRIGEIEIAGKLYPLNFSMCVAQAMAERYGCVEDVWNYIGKKSYQEMMKEFIWILSLLIEQGCKYRQLMDGESIEPLSFEKLEICMSVSEILRCRDVIMQTMVDAMSTEVEVEQIKKKAETMAHEWMQQASHGRSTTEEPLAFPATSTEPCP